MKPYLTHNSYYVIIGISLLLVVNYISSLEENYVLSYSSLAPSISKLLLPISILVVATLLFGHITILLSKKLLNKYLIFKLFAGLILICLGYALIKAFLSLTSLRWQDIGLFILGSELGRDPLISFFWEMLLPLVVILHVIFLKIKYYSYLKFIGISGYIIFFIFTYRHIVYFDYELGDSPSSNYVVSEPVSDRQVLWIVFDEFDPEFAFNSDLINELPVFKDFKTHGVYNKFNYSPGDNTMYSLPAMLMGRAISGYSLAGKQRLDLIDLNGAPFSFGYSGSVFEKLTKKGYSSSIYAIYHPYCMIFKSIDCKEIQPFDVKWHSGLTRFPTRILNIYAPQLNPISPLNSGNLLSIQLDGLSDFLREKKQEFLFVHLLLPHLPAVTAQDYYKKYVSGAASEDAYKLNLKFTDHVLTNILDSLPKDGRKRMVILTSDHWYRARNPSQPHPALWIAKIDGDSQGFTNMKPTNSIYTPAMINEYLDGKINTNADIYKYFLNKPNTGTYISSDNKVHKHQ